MALSRSEAARRQRLDDLVGLVAFALLLLALVALSTP